MSVDGHAGVSRAHGPRRAASQVRMGDFNQTVILEAIRHSTGGLSRVELAALTGMSAQSISNIARQLLDAGLVVEAGRVPVGRGKPRTTLALNASGQYAVGIHLDPAVITYVILDLCGTTVAHVRHPTPTVIDPQGVIADIAATVSALIESSGIDRSVISGVGIAAPGPIDIVTGVVADPPNLDGWVSVPLREELRRALRLPVVLDKDVTAAAAGQKWAGGPAGTGDFAFLYLGTGVGAGLVVNGQVVRGTSHNVGEIGEFNADGPGPLGPEGAPMTIGATAQPRYLVRRGLQAGVLTGPIDVDDRQALELACLELGRAAVAGDHRARSILTEVLGRVIRVAVDLANLLDLDHVVCGGPYWPILEPFLTEAVAADFRRRFVVQQIHEVTIMGTSLGIEVGAVGAASLVLEHTFSTNPSALLFTGT